MPDCALSGSSARISLSSRESNVSATFAPAEAGSVSMVDGIICGEVGDTAAGEGENNGKRVCVIASELMGDEGIVRDESGIDSVSCVFSAGVVGDKGGLDSASCLFSGMAEDIVRGEGEIDCRV